ncbi:MAG: alpha-ketoglutarate-dependent dioxygenase AlkB [Proteobacteria bacterium]|nr:alpha-ketoglutarate-dependent dioxygenase AlkB [Pseudomonadota bacterium]MCP4915935.1 alpha-ketoglutarate-dependent dioxygenase AlkB [Pseudomonadota bacterium]
MLARQLGLLSPPVQTSSFDGVRRLDLGRGAWIDHAPGWLRGHSQVFETLYRGMAWQQRRRWMYEREVDEPRLTARIPRDGPGHPVISRIASLLSERYDAELTGVSLALYRDGQDSVAPHGDTLLRDSLDHSLVATVSVGEPRRFLIRPRGGGASHRFELGWGDLCVMGGTCQATWEHGVPKQARALPRIAVMFRVSRG